MYEDIILDHYKNPRNFGTLTKPSSSITVHNPLCGDVITMQVEFKGNKVTKVAFSGEGCAISRASASLLTEFIKNKDISKLRKIGKNDMMNLIGIDISPARIKCLLLSLEAVKRIINR